LAENICHQICFGKMMARVPKPGKTSEIFLAPGHEFTFPSHVQDLIEKNAAAHILKKASAAAAACLNIFIFSGS